jgi:hypothetical protein
MFRRRLCAAECGVLVTLGRVGVTSGNSSPGRTKSQRAQEIALRRLRPGTVRPSQPEPGHHSRRNLNSNGRFHRMRVKAIVRPRLCGCKTWRRSQSHAAAPGAPASIVGIGYAKRIRQKRTKDYQNMLMNKTCAAPSMPVPARSGGLFGFYPIVVPRLEQLCYTVLMRATPFLIGQAERQGLRLSCIERSDSEYC